MNKYRLSIFRIISTAFLFIGLLSAPLMGQSLLVEQAESTIEIKQDNLVRAKAEALKTAKGNVVMQAVAKFLDFERLYLTN